MLQITEAQVLAKLTMAKAVELVEMSFRQLADGTAVNHPRRRVILPTGSILHYMAAGNGQYFGTKVYSTNPKTGAHFTFLLYRSEDGLPLAQVEANHLGQIRTGAASGAATKFLAREDASTLGVIGTGFQAETQIEAMSLVRNLREVRVWSRGQERRETFAAKCAARFGVNVRAVETAREAVECVDIVVTATSSKVPVLEADWISPGTHVNAMGSNWLIKRELPTELVLDRGALVTVDSVEDALLESGDLVTPMKERGLSEVPAVNFSPDVKRTSASQITIFKSNGLAIQDVVSTGYLFEAYS